MANSEPELTSISSAVGDYLKALWIHAKDDSVSTGDLATSLNVTAPSVSGMLLKLKALGLIEYERYRGAKLTEEGRREALRLIRRHRLLETFLIDYLGYSWHEVHEEAEAMEHVMSDRFTERLAERLGQPSHDPHGDPIPRPDGTLPETPSVPLTDAERGECFRVFRLRTQDTELLTYLQELSIVPGQLITIERREPFGNLLHLDVGGQREAISKELASIIVGQVVDQSQRLEQRESY